MTSSLGFPASNYPLNQLPAAQVNEIKDLAIYIVVAAALDIALCIGCCVWCSRHRAWLHREHTEDEKEKIVQMKSRRTLNASSSNIGMSSPSDRKFTRASSAYTRSSQTSTAGGSSSPSKRVSSSKRQSRKSRQSNTPPEHLMPPPPPSKTDEKTALRMKQLEEENNALRMQVQSHNELFAQLEEDEDLEEMDEDVPAPLNSRPSETIN